MLAAAKQPGFPTPFFVHRAATETAARFFTARAPDAKVIADPDGQLFAAFGLGKGSFAQLFGLRVFVRAFAAMFRGHFAGKPTSHATQMPGAFVVQNGDVLWSHRARHTGDHPDLSAMRRALDPNAPAANANATPVDQSRRLASLTKEHRRVLAEAQKQQRNGDLRAFADLTARADEIARELDALEQSRA